MSIFSHVSFRKIQIKMIKQAGRYYMYIFSVEYEIDIGSHKKIKHGSNS